MFSITDKQNQAMQLILDWYRNFNPVSSKPIFVLAGVGGSGKSTLISYITREELGLSEKEIAICCYTGMATTVLSKKGTPAQTIHSLAYILVDNDSNSDPEFRLKTKEEFHRDNDVKLIIIDEVSQVSKKMMEDLMTFEIPILATGDPFQLPPIGTDNNEYISHPDFFLDEVLRQALDNPIIWLSNEIRVHKRKPKIGTYGDKVKVMSKNDFDEDVLMVDQIIAGKNDTVNMLNKFYRKNILGYKSSDPPRNGEKLMCLRNNWGLYCEEKGITMSLVNGLTGYADILSRDPNAKYTKIDFRPVYFEHQKFKGILMDDLYYKDKGITNFNYLKEFYPEVAFKRVPLISTGMKINLFTYGYCCTVYKSQGSDFGSVTYFDEVLKRDMYYRHFYTAVTRAVDTLNILL